MDDTHDTTDISALAREVLAELEPGSYGDKFVLTRRQAIAVSTGAISLGALGVAGVGNASAQSGVGQVGTEAEPVDVEGAQGNFSQGVTVDGPLEAGRATIDNADDFGVIETLIQSIGFDGGDKGVEISTQFNNVDDSITTIHEVPDVHWTGAVVMVQGAASSTTGFTDFVLFNRIGGNIDVFASISRTSDSREYNSDFSVNTLELSMGSLEDAGSYDTRTMAISLGANQ